MILLFLFVILHNPLATENKVCDIGLISKSIKKWGNYWFDYYELKKVRDFNTKKRLKKKKIQNLGLAISRHESNFNLKCITWEPVVQGNAYGHMQVLSTTAKSIGWDGKDVNDLLDPEKNSKYGMKFLCMKIKEYNGNLEYALAAYNAGKARWNKKGVFRNQYYVDSVFSKFVRLNKFDSIQKTRTKK